MTKKNENARNQPGIYFNFNKKLISVLSLERVCEEQWRRNSTVRRERLNLYAVLAEKIFWVLMAAEFTFISENF